MNYKDEIYMHTPCKATMIINKLNHQWTKYKDINYLYMLEHFSKKIQCYEQFFKDLVFNGISKEGINNDNTIAFNAIGNNEILIVYSKRNINNTNPQQGIFYNLNKKLIKHIYRKMPPFSDSFVKYYFAPSDQSTIYVSDNIIICIDILYSFMTNFIKNIKNKESDILKKEDMMDYTYKVIVRCDNHKLLLKKFNKGDYGYVKSALNKSNYRNILFLTKSELNKLKIIREEIFKFFEKYEISSEKISIDIPIFNYSYGNDWIHMYVKIIDIYNSDYDYERLTYFHKVITLDDLINTIEYMRFDKVHKVLDDKYQASIPYNIIKVISDTTNVNYNRKEYIINMDDKKQINDDIFMKDANIIKNNKIGNMKIVRILKQKNSNISSLCSVSICCVIDDKHFIINIIPRTLSYIKWKTINNNFDIIEYINQGTIIYETDTTNSKIVLEKHNKLRYTIEFISIDPHNCSGCKLIKSNNQYVDRTVLFIKKLLFIKLDENYNISNLLLNCYKKYFNIKMYLVIYNIIRNIIIFYRKNKEKLNECKKLIKKIIELESIYNEKNGCAGITITKLLENYETEDFYMNNDKIYISDSHKCKFVCVPSTKFSDTKIYETNFKLLVWYVTPDIYKLNDIKKSINKIKKYINDRIIKKSDASHKTLSDGDINKEMFVEIYDIKDTRSDKIINNEYIYNISSLVSEQYKYKKDYKYLKKFIDNVLIKYEIKDYNYVFYHYLTGYMTATLHLHIFKKHTTIESTNVNRSLTSIITVGHRSNFSHMYAKYITWEFKKFDVNIWYKHHYVLFTILCTDNFIRFVKDKGYSEMIKDMYKKEKKYINKETIINEFIEFTYECIKDDVIPDYMMKLNYKAELEIYYRELYSYNNNIDKIIMVIYNLLRLNK